MRKFNIIVEGNSEDENGGAIKKKKRQKEG